MCGFCYRLIWFVFACVAVSSAYADTNANLCEKAYKEYIFSEAYPICLIAAESGNSVAQKNVARMLLSGSGVAKNEKKAVEWLRKAAPQGNSIAQAILAVVYADGVGTNKDSKEADRLFKKAASGLQKEAEKGNFEAQDIFSSMYEWGNGVVKDEAKALFWLQKAANSERWSQYRLGEKYRTGHSVKQDEVEAVKWLRKAAEQGLAVAQYKLGLMYFVGQGVEQNSVEAVNWYNKAAEQKNDLAQYMLGSIYLYKQEYGEAAQWYRKAAEQGNADAQLQLGLMYRNMQGVAYDEEEELKWFKKAAEQGHAEAQYELAKKYLYGEHTDANKQEADRWFRKSAERGYLYAQNHLSLHYSLEKNYSEAAKWTRMAAEQGDAGSQETLGWMYRNGKGVKQDYGEAEKWFRKAALQGHASSQSQLGDLYYNGLGVEKDFSIAFSWYKKAADQGEDDAQNELGSMYLHGESVPKNYAEAVNWFRKSAEQGNVKGQWNLASTYYNGEGVSRDKIQSLAWFTLAGTTKVEAAKIRDDIEKELKPIDVAQAQQLAAKYKTEIDNRLDQKYGLAKKQEITKQVVVKATNQPITIPKIVNPSFTSDDFAVIIGIEKYRSVPATEYATADASKVREFISALGIPERNIEFLTDDRATLSDIRKVIETKLPKMVKPTSRVMVFYAGHGAPGVENGDSYLVPYDGDPSFLPDTAYPLTRLYDHLSRLPAKEVLVVLDSCFSGTGGRSVLAQGTRPLVMVKDTQPPLSQKMIVLTSASGNQITTSLPEVGHGAFTYFFLRALQEGKHDVGEVFDYLQTRVADEAKRRNVEQNPVIYPSVDKLQGRFVFAQ